MKKDPNKNVTKMFKNKFKFDSDIWQKILLKRKKYTKHIKKYSNLYAININFKNITLITKLLTNRCASNITNQVFVICLLYQFIIIDVECVIRSHLICKVYHIYYRIFNLEENFS